MIKMSDHPQPNPTSGLIPAMKNIYIKIPSNTKNVKCNIFVSFILFYFPEDMS